MDFKKINIKKVKKISSWLILGLLLIILVFVLFPLLPIENNYSLKMVLSGSMKPTIKTGAIVMVKPTSNYQIGDIVTYQYGRKTRDLTTHRIIGQRGDEFITKGDNNNAADIHPIKKEQIIGRVIFNIPYAGYVANFTHSKFGIILLVLIPAVLIIYSESLKIFKEVKKMRQKGSKIKKMKIKISIFLILFFIFSTLHFVNVTNAYFSDSVVLENNNFRAGYWVPVLNPIGDKSGTEGQILQFTISATDPNGDTLTYSASNLPTGAGFDPNTQLFSWTPLAGQAGTYANVLFEVSDGKYTDFENITITIAVAPAVQISDIQVGNITSSSAIISWQTSEPVASSIVVYGEEAGNYVNTSCAAVLNDYYSVQLESLSADTLYHFRVKVIDNLGREGFSGDNTFTTEYD